MSNPTFQIRTGDLLPVIDVRAKNTDGTNFDLTGALSATFKMRRDTGSNWLVDAAATIVDVPGGHLRYTWTGSQTAIPGTYYAVIILTYASGRTLTVPTTDDSDGPGYIVVSIV